MPRNSSGTYSLPAGNPVVSGTLIEASWANTTLSDLASAMTGSLSRAGEGGMTAALRLFDGTVSLPGVAFTNETSTGLYRAGSGDMRLAVTGSQVMQFLSTGVAVTGTLSASGNTTLSGTLAVTGASTFSGQTNTFENSTAYYPQLINRNKTNDANGSYISLQKIRNTSIVQNGDVLGNVIFAGYDGAAYLQGAFINAVVSATPGTNDMPADLVFGTTSDGGAGPTERLRISNTGAGTASADWTFYGVRVGRGAGAVSTNTAVGASALAANTSGLQNTGIGANALVLNTSGNYSVAVGFDALAANTTGANNTAVGRRALYSNTTASNNLAFGFNALFSNTTGANNTAIGADALTSSGTASNNTAVGYQSMYSNTTGGSNTAFGRNSMRANTTASDNTAIGDAALYSNTTGTALAAVGAGALYSSTTGNYNTAFGRSALELSTTAGQNTAVGYQSMYSSNGSDNTAIGYRSGFNITTGVGNICLGYNSVLNNGADNYSFVCGVNATSKGGNSGYFSMGGMYQGNNSASWNTTSDRRLKKNIVDFKIGLEKITAIKVRNFEYRLAEEIEDLAPSNAIAISGIQLGVIAQELQEVLPECVTQESSGVLSVNPDKLTWYLINAIQELKAEIDTLKGQA